MLTKERFDRILQLLHERKAVTVAEISEVLKISESTARRDLSELDRLGKLSKVHGGAVLLEVERSTFEEDVIQKSTKNIEDKRKIAKYAAELINDDDLVYLDAGTTTEQMIDFIKDTKAVFVTNGISHVRKLTQKGIKAYLLGGELKLSTEAMVGPEALDAVKKFNFTKSFLGVNGIHEKFGYTTPDLSEAAIKKEVLSRSFMNCILSDHTKFGQVSSVSFGNLNQACIITDLIGDKRCENYTVIKVVTE